MHYEIIQLDFNRLVILLNLLIICFATCSNIKDDDLKIEEEDLILNQHSEYIIVLGDIQEYTSQTSNIAYYKGTMNWIRSQQQNYDKSITCILQVGDVTNSNVTTQWQRFYDCTATTSEAIPYITCTGNHDYDWDEESRINDRNSTQINLYAIFPLMSKNIVAFFEEGKIENIVVANEIYGERYDILVLEFGPRTEVVEWANDYVSAHRDRKFILMTHEFLTRKGERVSSGSYAEIQIRNSSWSSPEDVWKKLVKDNNNIVCVLCGHNGFSAQLYSQNTAGRDVPQVLFNLQYQANGGDGWIQLWEFPEQSDSVSVSVYNTIRRESHPDVSTSFKFRYKY